jgi:elongation factor Ts
MNISAADVKKLREQTGVGMMDCKKALVETDGDLEAAVKYLREKGLAKAAKKADREAKEGYIFIQTDASSKMGVILQLNCETDFVATNSDFKAVGSTIAQTALSENASSIEEIKSKTIEGKPFDTFVSDAVMKLGENITLGHLQKVQTEGQLSNYVHMNGKIGVLIEFSAAIDVELGRDIAMHIAASNPLYVDQSKVPQEELAKEKEVVKAQVMNEGKPENIVDRIVDGKIGKYLKEICLVDQVFVKDTEKKVSQVLPEGVNVVQFIRYSLG